MVLMEAWAQGVPTVASDVGGCGEISRASGGGSLAAGGDASSFAEHLLALLTDREAAAAKGRSGMAWVRANCDPAVASSRFAAILSSLLPALNESSSPASS
jgi:phosphatidylinositol alpha-1,6-mannosyltransferase